MTFHYVDSTAVLGPLALSPEPGTYDLCTKHAESTSAPRGWEMIRLPQTDPAQAEREAEADDDLMALADAVRQIGLRDDEQLAPAAAPEAPQVPATPRLRVIRDA